MSSRIRTVAVAALLLGGLSIATGSPALAGNGGAVAAGVIGGLAAGAIVGSAAANAGYGYGGYGGYGGGYGYPAYGAPAYGGGCYLARQATYDPYGNFAGYRHVQVCN